jgi:hypothetical protein
MAMHTYHIYNVLRAYSEQLRQKTLATGERRSERRKPSERMTVSAHARRKAIIEKVTSDVVDRIILHSSGNHMKPGAVKKRESRGFSKPSPSKSDSSTLVFKVLGKEQEGVTKTLSMDDQDSFKEQLKGILR